MYDYGMEWSYRGKKWNTNELKSAINPFKYHLYSCTSCGKGSHCEIGLDLIRKGREEILEFFDPQSTPESPSPEIPNNSLIGFKNTPKYRSDIPRSKSVSPPLLLDSPQTQPSIVRLKREIRKALKKISSGREILARVKKSAQTLGANKQISSNTVNRVMTAATSTEFAFDDCKILLSEFGEDNP